MAPRIDPTIIASRTHRHGRLPEIQPVRAGPCHQGCTIWTPCTLKIMLVSSPAPVATNAVKANLTEIIAQNGYPAGGLPAVSSSRRKPPVRSKLVLADVTFTGSGGPFGPFRYAVLYNDTPTSPAKP